MSVFVVPLDQITCTTGADAIAVAVKSGNFTSVDFFGKALAKLEDAA